MEKKLDSASTKSLSNAPIFHGSQMIASLARENIAERKVEESALDTDREGQRSCQVQTQRTCIGVQEADALSTRSYR